MAFILYDYFQLDWKYNNVYYMRVVFFRHISSAENVIKNVLTVT